jgi:hypothetical protein
MRLRRIAPGLTVFAATVIAPGICASASAETQAARTVLTVYWGAESFPGTERIDAAVQSELRTYAGGPVNYFAEYLETEEFPQEVARRRCAITSGGSMKAATSMS